jgi:translation initiation factor IF-2
MAEVSMEKLAETIDTTVDKLLQQLGDAGITKGENDNVSESEKAQLLDYLSKQHGGTGAEGPERMTLQRKSKSTLSVKGSTGKEKTVQVEVRKKRTYVKKSTIDQEKEQERLAIEEAARKEAELKAQQLAEQKAKEDAAAEEEKSQAAPADPAARE